MIVSRILLDRGAVLHELGLVEGHQEACGHKVRQSYL